MRLSNRILVSEDRLRERVDALASAIAADTEPTAELSVLGLLDGAFMFCADLIRRLPMPIRLALVPMPSVTRGGDPASTVLPADFPVRDTDLLVVEDILDTGRTLAALSRRLESLGPRRLRTAVLLDKPVRRQVEFVAQYVGFTVPDRWVVGYGLDSDGLYRNLPYITYIED